MSEKNTQPFHVPVNKQMSTKSESVSSSESVNGPLTTAASGPAMVLQTETERGKKLLPDLNAPPTSSEDDEAPIADFQPIMKGNGKAVDSNGEAGTSTGKRKMREGECDPIVVGIIGEASTSTGKMGGGWGEANPIKKIMTFIGNWFKKTPGDKEKQKEEVAPEDKEN